jgi:hypothetical protein
VSSVLLEKTYFVLTLEKRDGKREAQLELLSSFKSSDHKLKFPDNTRETRRAIEDVAEMDAIYTAA